MLEFNNTNLKHAYELAAKRDDFFYGSETYKNAKDRYETYRNAYYRKHDTSSPIWKSKLYFPVFFMACKAFEAEIKKTIQEPLANINFRSRGKYDPALDEKEKLINADVKNDLYISGFERTLFRMYWFNETFGVSCGRETMVGERKINKKRKVVMNQYGGQTVQETNDVQISEHTDTDMIHALNFAHALNRGEFYNSPWATVRYELSISDLYYLRNHPLANQKGIDKAIKQIEDGRYSGWSNGDKSFYVDSNDYKSGDQDTIIVTEYSGNLQFKGNLSDNRLYWGIYSSQFECWLLLGPSPFQRHPFWKMRCHPDPFGPYGVSPNVILIPFNVLRNTLFNQYIDFTNANLKYLYQVFSPYIRGGLRSLIDGLPGGIVEAIDEMSWNKGDLIKPIRKESGGIPGMSDAFNILEKSEVEYAIASSRKRAVEGVSETATGEMQIAEQQDAAIESVVRDTDHGLQDCIHQKITNRVRFITTEQSAMLEQIADETPDVRYFPFELGGEDFDVTVNRKSPMVEANKYMAFLSKVGEGMQIVQSGGGLLNPQAVMEIYDEVGRKIGLDKVDRVWQAQQPGLPPEIGANTGPQAGAGTAPNNMPKAAQPAMSPGAANAVAIA